MPLIACDEDVVIEVVRLPADELLLEGRLGYPEAGLAQGAAVIAGPHPLLGGDLRNNVVTALTADLARRSTMTLSFNYRGVGDSDGHPPDVAGHLAEFWQTSQVVDEPAYRDDLRAATVYLRELAGDASPIGLIGYSFGCSLLPFAISDPDQPIVLIAPTVGTHDYNLFTALRNPLLVIAPDGDFAADANLLASWFDELSQPKQMVRGRWDDHFFRGHENWLAGVVGDFLDVHWGTGKCR